MNDSQNGENETKEEGALKDGFQVVKNRKGKGKIGEQADGVRRSSRLEAYEDIKVLDMAISRAEAKDAFIHSANPYSVSNTDDSTLCEIAASLNISFGCNEIEKSESLSLIRSVEKGRSSLLLQSVTRRNACESGRGQ
ncbi:hypothetical protein Zm00014a_043686 [Zea mays]|uniref:Uncharacterized protein n=1 Tax=Zea mays TaxID=4577 RepID=A0A3L6G040_MAIZE|nr:hypothetical protein Zm00014a_043686 [Zea mays]